MNSYGNAHYNQQYLSNQAVGGAKIVTASSQEDIGGIVARIEGRAATLRDKLADVDAWQSELRNLEGMLASLKALPATSPPQ